KAALQFLLARQDESGGWSGNWQVLTALEAVEFDMHSLPVRRAVRWLKESQHEDGGWGESDSSTATRTAWALVGLLAAGEAESAEVRAGAEFLVGTQRADGGWNERTHQSACFALMALGRCLAQTGSRYSACVHTRTAPRSGVLSSRHE